MKFQLNTDAHIQGDERMTEIAQSLISQGLGHLTNRLSRIEVYLADENGPKRGADDIRCTIEARPEGLKPHTITHHSASVKSALRGGTKKMRTHLQSEFGKLSHQ